MRQQPYRINSITPLSGGGLQIVAHPPDAGGAVAKGFGVFEVADPALASMLAQAAATGEVWELTLADDGRTVIGAAYHGAQR